MFLNHFKNSKFWGPILTNIIYIIYKDKYGFSPECYFEGHTTNAGNCVYFHFDFISRKQTIKETVLLRLHFKIYFLI